MLCYAILYYTIDAARRGAAERKRRVRIRSGRLRPSATKRDVTMPL